MIAGGPRKVLAERGKERQACRQHHQRFGVHVGHIEETALGCVEGLVGAGRHRFLRQHQRHAILGKGQGRASVQLPRELIEDDDFGQTTGGGGAPNKPFAARQRPMGVRKTLGDQAVEARVGGEPILGTVLDEPEGDDGFRRLHR